MLLSEHHQFVGTEQFNSDGHTTQFTVPIPVQPDTSYRVDVYFTADDAEDVWGSVSVPIVTKTLDSFILKFQSPPGQISWQANWTITLDA